MTSEKLTLYYDGNCPLCLAEIHLLKQHNHRNLLFFVNLHELEASTSDINCKLAMQSIHARLGQSEIISGPRVFQEAYKRTDLRLMNAFFSKAWFRFFYAKFYTVFAKYRHPISKFIGPCLLRWAKRHYP